jgi:hypothetical protein
MSKGQSHLVVFLDSHPRLAREKAVVDFVLTRIDMPLLAGPVSSAPASAACRGVFETGRSDQTHARSNSGRSWTTYTRTTSFTGHVKPGNIMLDRAGGDVRPIITDFGLAKVLGDSSLVSQSAVAGTFAYISPEQIEARRDIDGRADIYALGVMTYQMLAGELPFQHEHQGALLIAHMLHAPPNAREKAPDLPEHAARAIQKAMAKKPSERFGTAMEFASALEGE